MIPNPSLSLERECKLRSLGSYYTDFRARTLIFAYGNIVLNFKNLRVTRKIKYVNIPVSQNLKFSVLHETDLFFFLRGGLCVKSFSFLSRPPIHDTYV